MQKTDYFFRSGYWGQAGSNVTLPAAAAVEVNLLILRSVTKVLNLASSFFCSLKENHTFSVLSLLDIEGKVHQKIIMGYGLPWKKLSMLSQMNEVYFTLLNCITKVINPLSKVK